MAQTTFTPSRTLQAALRPPQQDLLPLIGPLVALWQAAAHRRALRRLSPHLLRDIGLSDGDIAALKSDPEPLR